jgi:hypothetical protein
VNFAGILEIKLLDDFVPTPANAFEIITGASLGGTFDYVFVSSPSGTTGTFGLNVTATGLQLSNFQPGRPGDFP